ncbi:hypothetical protein [Methylobacterium soli]|uniref:Uncharacterized protein n=1 Tax=Methylobacterium soli TaxID=553447 RepID=A0A6L3SZD0_9HYPH|nr:hypothetical protein [Methylobacterium soli]KAB1079404.1 hypothetical protein F6X53_11415 [Methylobacterium soli]GJE45381.1 hypothetical protein AEGHOMDF_4575 [Methylobacterium soli]
MALSDFTDNFRVANNEGWYGAFSLMLGRPGSAPWSGVPAWARGTAYGPGSTCTYLGDLYVARPNPSDPNWTSGNDFESDLDSKGASRWIVVAYLASWTQVPYDLTGCTVEFAIKPVDDFGNLTSSFATLSASSGDGEISITNEANGGVAFAIPPGRTSAVAFGLYRYDLVATHADGRRDRVRYGLWVVDEGIA